MSASKPILVLQMQRMGDLILSYPLLIWLTRTFPGHPIQVVAEAAFFTSLTGLGPQVTYTSWTDTAGVTAGDYLFVLNLSHRDEAARLAGAVRAEARFGPVIEESGAKRIFGNWQLYRASLVHNNRHNLFHWAELNALDVIPLDTIASTIWPAPRRLPQDSRNVGLFTGASEEAKRPAAEFYTALALDLHAKGFRPVLLGGPADAPLAGTVHAAVLAAGAKVINLCGRMSLAELAKAGQTMRLLVTPDTGPMHLAAWTGLLCLNVSMGPVNPWETGPYQPGHVVARAAMSCLGCWDCAPGGHPCRGRFEGRRAGAVIRRFLRQGNKGLTGTHPAGMLLFRTGRDASGLYELHSLDPGRAVPHSLLLSRFWRDFWGLRFGILDRERVLASWAALAGAAPRLTASLSAGLAGLGRDLGRTLKPGGSKTLADDFWTARPSGLRPLTGYLPLLLANADYSRQSWLEALATVEDLASLLV